MRKPISIRKNTVSHKKTPGSFNGTERLSLKTDFYKPKGKTRQTLQTVRMQSIIQVFLNRPEDPHQRGIAFFMQQQPHIIL